MLDKKENIIEQENKENIEKEISLKKSINSVIMEEKDFDMIKSAIEKVMNKEIKGIKKLFQATINDGDYNIFHYKCDNISNTLILYESAGNRKFGGFASQSWGAKGGPVTDKNCFLFSLDNKKVYFPKNENYFSVPCSPYIGPSFTSKNEFIIKIDKNIFNKKALYTRENSFKLMFDYDKNALSEDGNFFGIDAKEYEVFEILF